MIYIYGLVSTSFTVNVLQNAMLSSTSAILEQPWLLFGGSSTMNQLKGSSKILVNTTLVSRRSVISHPLWQHTIGTD